MESVIEATLKKICQAIQEIEGFTNDISTFSDFQNDVKTKRAVERDFDIIGKGLSRLLTKKHSHHLSNVNEIIAVKKKLARSNEQTYDQTLWGLIRTRSLSLLKKEIEQLMEMRDLGSVASKTK